MSGGVVMDDKTARGVRRLRNLWPRRRRRQVDLLRSLCLQHRGQESAGIATSDGRRLYLRTRLGLVSQAFAEDDLRDLPGEIAIWPRPLLDGPVPPTPATPVP
jgi:hypothetical protein